MNHSKIQSRVPCPGSQNTVHTGKLKQHRMIDLCNTLFHYWQYQLLPFDELVNKLIQGGQAGFSTNSTCDNCLSSQPALSANKIPWTVWLNQLTVLFSQFWRPSPRTRCKHGRILVKSLLLTCTWLPSHCVLMWARGAGRTDGQREGEEGGEQASCLMPPLVRTLILSYQGPTLVPSFNLNYSL